MQNLHSLEFLTETFLCDVHHFQCLPVPVELAAMKFVFLFMVVGIAEMLVWLCQRTYEFGNVLNYQLHYKTHILFDTITHATHTNISAIPTTMNRKTNFITASSTRTAKHWSGAHGTEKLLLKTQVSEDFL